MHAQPVTIADRIVSLGAPVLFFCPHPDDLSICAGALVARLADLGHPVKVFLMTSGADARIPLDFIHSQYPDGSRSGPVLYDLRARIREDETKEEMVALGLREADLKISHYQRWAGLGFTDPANLNDDLTISDLAHFRPGPFSLQNRSEISSFIMEYSRGSAIIMVPFADDKLIVHTLTSEFVQSVVGELSGEYRIMFYEALSCLADDATLSKCEYFYFSKELMERKILAINTHRSMKARRARYGGYSNSGTAFYDEIVLAKNARIATGSSDERSAYAERYMLMD